MGVHPSWKVSEVNEKVWENQIVCVCVRARERVFPQHPILIQCHFQWFEANLKLISVRAVQYLKQAILE